MITTIANIFLGLMPACLVVWFLIKQNKFSLPSISYGVTSFILGIIIALPAAWAYGIYGNVVGTIENSTSFVLTVSCLKLLFENVILILATVPFSKRMINSTKTAFIMMAGFATTLNMFLVVPLSNVLDTILFLLMMYPTYMVQSLLLGFFVDKASTHRQNNNETKYFQSLLCALIIPTVINVATYHLYVAVRNPVAKFNTNHFVLIFGSVLLTALYVFISLLVVKKAAPMKKKKKEFKLENLLEKWPNLNSDEDCCPKCGAELVPPYDNCFNCDYHVERDLVSKEFLTKLLNTKKFVPADKFIDHYINDNDTIGCFVVLRFSGLPDIKYSNYDSVYIGAGEKVLEAAHQFIENELASYWGSYLMVVPCEQDQLHIIQKDLITKYPTPTNNI